jgi:hypothetical protein
MNPVIELQKMLAKVATKRQVGKVLRVNGNILTVSTGNTTVRVRNTSATSYKAGNLVSVQGEVLLGKAGSGLQPQIFRV